MKGNVFLVTLTCDAPSWILCCRSLIFSLCEFDRKFATCWLNRKILSVCLQHRSFTRNIIHLRVVVFVAASHQTRLDTRSKARRPIKVWIKGRGRSGRSRDSNPACQCCSSAHWVQCEPDEASSFTNPNVGPGTYASLRLKLDAWSSAVQRGQKCSSPTRRLPSRSWGPIRPRVCSWFRAPIRHECQTAQLKSRGVKLPFGSSRLHPVDPVGRWPHPVQGGYKCVDAHGDLWARKDRVDRARVVKTVDARDQKHRVVTQYLIQSTTEL